MSIFIKEGLKAELRSFDLLEGKSITDKVDATESMLAEQWGQRIELYHVPTDVTIVFKASPSVT